MLFEIIMRRYETRSTMMTSNRPLEDWGKLIGDVPSATAILDRFLHHAEIIQITGKSYRLRNQQPNPGTTLSARRQRRQMPPFRPPGRNEKRAVHRQHPMHLTLAKSNICTEDSIPTTPAAEFRPAMAAFDSPDDSYGRFCRQAVRKRISNPNYSVKFFNSSAS